MAEADGYLAPAILPKGGGWAVGLFQRWDRIPARVQDRLTGLTLALPTGAVLGTALWLQAYPAGVGTHRQLGLGGCTVLTLTGYPCPMCGMTTTFTHMAHLQILDALKTQPFGVLLFSVTLAAFLLGSSDLVAPAGRWRRALAWILSHEVQIAAGLLGGMGLGWIYKLIAMAA